MQRLALAILFVAIVLALVVLAARIAIGVLRPMTAPTSAGAVQPRRDGMVERIAYIILFGVTFGTAAGWLGDL